MLEEIKDSGGQVITFIDELHTVVGAGAGGDSAMDAGNMLKPMLARGELHMIGATTLDEYRERIEKDPALERRFQQVFVGRAHRRGHHPDPARHPGEVRSAPRRPHHRRRPGRRRDALRPLHHRPAAAGQGDRPHRRGGVPAADGDRVLAGGDRPAPPPGRPAEDGGVRAREGDRRRLGRAARRPAQGPRRQGGGAARARRPLGAREDLARGRGRAAPPARPAADGGRQADPRGQPRGGQRDPLRPDPGAGGADREGRGDRRLRASSRWSARRSAPSRSPTSSRPGPASPPAGCSRARPPSCSGWRTSSASG